MASCIYLFNIYLYENIAFCFNKLVGGIGAFITVFSYFVFLRVDCVYQ